MSRRFKEIETIIKNELESFKQEFKTKQPTKFLTRQQVADLLSISLTTLWRYTRDGVLNSHQVGGRVLYKEEEIHCAIIKINN